MQKGLLVAGLSGGSGKSVVAVGLCAAYAKQGLVVAPFKKGPDYIDAGWLALAAGRSCYNLDPFLMTWQALQDSFAEHCQKTELAIVEGNRGLYDGSLICPCCWWWTVPRPPEPSRPWFWVAGRWTIASSLPGWC